MSYLSNLFDWFAGPILGAIVGLVLGFCTWLKDHTGVDLVAVGSFLKAAYTILWLVLSPWVIWNVFVLCVIQIIVLGLGMVLLRFVLWLKGHFWSASS